MKEYSIHIDVTMSGNVYVSANSKEEAYKKAKEMSFVGSDLTNFYFLDSSIVEIEEN